MEKDENDVKQLMDFIHEVHLNRSEFEKRKRMKRNARRYSYFVPDKTKPNGLYGGLPHIVSYFNIYNGPVREKQCLVYCKLCDDPIVYGYYSYQADANIGGMYLHLQCKGHDFVHNNFLSDQENQQYRCFRIPAINIFDKSLNISNGAFDKSIN